MKKIFTVLGIAAAAFMANAQIVINEVYGGGGNNGATYTHDFVELINNSNATATLTGGYVQYASATGAFSKTNVIALPNSITLQPKQTYLIQLAKGSGGTAALPSPDYVTPDNATLALSGTAGKIALTSSDVLVTAPNSSNVLDFVGWGTANASETAPAPATTNSTSIARTNGIDTNDNSKDFTVGEPTPQGSSMLGLNEINGKKIVLVKNTTVDQSLTFGAKADVKIYSVSGQLVKSTSVNDGTDMDVSGLAKGVYIVTGDVNGQKVSQKIIKK